MPITRATRVSAKAGESWANSEGIEVTSPNNVKSRIMLSFRRPGDAGTNRTGCAEIGLGASPSPLVSTAQRLHELSVIFCGACCGALDKSRHRKAMDERSIFMASCPTDGSISGLSRYSDERFCRQTSRFFADIQMSKPSRFYCSVRSRHPDRKAIDKWPSG